MNLTEAERIWVRLIADTVIPQRYRKYVNPAKAERIRVELIADTALYHHYRM